MKDLIGFEEYYSVTIVRIIDQNNNIIIEEKGMKNFMKKIDFKSSSIYTYYRKGFIPQGQFKSMKIEIIK